MSISKESLWWHGIPLSPLQTLTRITTTSSFYLSSPFVEVSKYVSSETVFLNFKKPRNRCQGSIPPAYIAWRAGKTTLFVLGSEPPFIDCSNFQAMLVAGDGKYVSKESMDRLMWSWSGANVLLSTFESTTAGFSSLPARGNLCKKCNYYSQVSQTKPCIICAAEKSKEER